MTDHQEQVARGECRGKPFCYSLPQICREMADVGALNLTNSLLKELVLGLLAGCYVALGMSLYVSATLQMHQLWGPPAVGPLPVVLEVLGCSIGLTLCFLNGASFFHSNCVYMTCALVEGKVTVPGAMRLILTSFFMNLCGVLWVLQLMTWGEIVPLREGFPLMKPSRDQFWTTLVDGILYSGVVCLAVWQDTRLHDGARLMAGIGLVSSAVVALGHSPCSGNLYTMLMIQMVDRDLPLTSLLRLSLVPTTIGSVLGSFTFMAVAHGLAWVRDWARTYAGHPSSSNCLAIFPSGRDGNKGWPAADCQKGVPQP